MEFPIPTTDHRPPGTDMAERLIVALDVPECDQARRLVDALDGVVSFYKIGLWLLFRPDAQALIDELVAAGKKVFLDYKMYDIGETVRRGVMAAADRGISIVTVHGDDAIMQAAVDGRGRSGLRVFAISVLTSMDDAGLAAMGYRMGVAELVALRATRAASCGCDGLIASPSDAPDRLRARAGAPDLLIATPGIRLADDPVHDHARPGTPGAAIRAGADYLVVGRSIIHAADPRARAELIIAQMRAA